MVLPSFLINNDYDNTLWYNVLQDNINIIVELKNKHPEFISKFEARGSTLKHFLKNNTNSGIYYWFRKKIPAGI